MMDNDINNNNNIHSEPYYAKEDEDDSIYTTNTNANHANYPTPSVYSGSSNTDKVNNFGDDNNDSSYYDANNKDYDNNGGSYYEPQPQPPVYDTDYYYDEDNDKNDHINNHHHDPNQPYPVDDDEQDALFRSHSDPNHHPPRKTTCIQKMIQCCTTCYAPKCNYRGPCRFPHGCCYSIMGIMSAVGGLMMNLYVVGTCLFQRIQKISLVTGDIIPGSQLGYGFLSRETLYGEKPDYKQCTWYTQKDYNEIFDGWMKTGRFFAFLSAMLATVCFIIMMMTCCVAFSRSMFEKWLFWMYIAAAISVAFSFFIFGNEFCKENDCKVADGCGWAISAFMFHLLAANTVKSFPAANAPNHKRPRNRRNRNNNQDDEDDDDDDDLYYETEEDKYPPKRPEGPRGVKIDKDGVRTFDDGEDYFNDMGEMIDPYDPEGLNKKSRRTNDDEDDYDDEDLDDVSDHDLEEYASDNEDDDEYEDEFNDDGRSRKTSKTRQYDENGNPIYTDDDEEETMYNVDIDDQTQATRHTSQSQQELDMYGNPIYDPDRIAERGNLGVGYEDEVVDEIQYDDYGQPVPPPPKYNDRASMYDGEPQPSHPEQISGLDDFGNTNYNFDRSTDMFHTNNDFNVQNNPFDQIPPSQPRKSFSSDDHTVDHDMYTTTSYPNDDTQSYQSYETYHSENTGHPSYNTDDAIPNHNDDPTASSNPYHGMATHLGQGSPEPQLHRRYSNMEEEDDDSDSHGPVFT